MYTHLKDFFDDWKMETEATVKIFTALTDKALDQKVYSEGRTLMRLAWHIVETNVEMLENAGLKMEMPLKEKNTPKVSLIIEEYKKSSEKISELLKKNWNDAILFEEIPMYGEQWKRGFVLTCLVFHQIHHRGQMTVLMRQAGLKVPGIYGPAKEEWVAMGMQPME